MIHKLDASIARSFVFSTRRNIYVFVNLSLSFFFYLSNNYSSILTPVKQARNDANTLTQIHLFWMRFLKVSQLHSHLKTINFRLKLPVSHWKQSLSSEHFWKIAANTSKANKDFINFWKNREKCYVHYLGRLWQVF